MLNIILALALAQVADGPANPLGTVEKTIQAPAILPEPSKELPVVLPAKVMAPMGRLTKIQGKSIGPITWLWYPGIRDMLDLEMGLEKAIILVPQSEGMYWVGACTNLDGKVSTPVWMLIQVGPGPNPPNPPKPPPDPAPFPATGLSVLIVTETADKLSIQQEAIITSALVRQYLITKCVKGPDGKTAEFRILDKDADMSKASELWQNAMKVPRQAVPWIVISDGKRGFSGPLPQTVQETMILLQKYGGS